MTLNPGYVYTGLVVVPNGFGQKMGLCWPSVYTEPVWNCVHPFVLCSHTIGNRSLCMGKGKNPNKNLLPSMFVTISL